MKVLSLFLYTLISFVASHSSFLSQYNLEQLSSSIPSILKNSTLNIKCFWINDKQVYSLYNLYNKTKDYEKPVKDGIIYYNFCMNTVEKCNGKEATVFYKKTKKEQEQQEKEGEGEEETCYNLAGPIEGTEESKNTWEELTNETNHTIGLKISLSKGESCPWKEGKFFKITYEIKCINDTKNQMILNFEDMELEQCNYIIKGESTYACPVNDYYRLKQFFESNKIVFAFVTIISGIVIALFGKKLFKVIAILLVAIIIVAVVGIFVVDLIKGWFKEEKSIWITLGITFIVGLIIGVTLLKCLDATFFLVGAGFGYIIGSVIYEVIMLYVTWDAKIVYWVTIIIFIILFGLLGIWVEILVTIVATSFIGSYAIIRGISFVCGHFPDLYQIFDLIEKQEWEQLATVTEYWALLYLGVWIILSIGTMTYQCKGNDGKSVKGESHEGYTKLKE